MVEQSAPIYYDHLVIKSLPNLENFKMYFSAPLVDNQLSTWSTLKVMQVSALYQKSLNQLILKGLNRLERLLRFLNGLDKYY